MNLKHPLRSFYKSIPDTKSPRRYSDNISIKPKESKSGKKFRNDALGYIFPVRILIFGLYFPVLDWFILKMTSVLSLFS